MRPLYRRTGPAFRLLTWMPGSRLRGAGLVTWVAALAEMTRSSLKSQRERSG